LQCSPYEIWWYPLLWNKVQEICWWIWKPL
jgi:hypothetical protein